MDRIKIFVDLDGVLVNFVGGLHRALGLGHDPELYPYKRGNYNMFPDVVTATKGRHTMDSLLNACRAVAFWENLDWDPRGNRILEILCKHTDDIYLASYPMDYYGSWVGKLKWINKYLPTYNSRVILLTAPKHFLAKPNTILIDDCDKNVEEFAAAGGMSYLTPQPWNSKHASCNCDWTELLESWMKKACKMISN